MKYECKEHGCGIEITAKEDFPITAIAMPCGCTIKMNWDQARIEA